MVYVVEEMGFRGKFHGIVEGPVWGRPGTSGSFRYKILHVICNDAGWISPIALSKKTKIHDIKEYKEQYPEYFL